LGVQGRSRLSIIDVGTPGKLISSACYDMQQVSVYLHSATVSCWSTVAEIACFEGVTKFDALLQRTPLIYRGSKLALLKPIHLMLKISSGVYWSISNDFGAVHSWNVFCSLKSWKIH